jgi:hypothetical protein
MYGWNMKFCGVNIHYLFGMVWPDGFIDAMKMHPELAEMFYNRR